MAKRIVLSDDVTGQEDDSVRTYTFMMNDMKFYQIDLSSSNIAKLEKLLKPYTSHMREVTRLTALVGSNGSNVARDGIADIRVWARQNGHDVGERGRIPEDVIAAYNEAHQTK